MQVAPQLSVGTAYKHDAVQPRGVSMIMSSDSAAVPYGMVPQFSTLQIGSSVSLLVIVANSWRELICVSLPIAVHKSSISILSAIHHPYNANGWLGSCEQRSIAWRSLHSIPTRPQINFKRTLGLGRNWKITFTLKTDFHQMTKKN